MTNTKCNDAIGNTKRTYYDVNTNQHYFMDYNDKTKTTMLHTAPAYYNAEDDEHVIDFSEKVALTVQEFNNKFYAELKEKNIEIGSNFWSPETGDVFWNEYYKKLVRRAKATARSASASASAKRRQIQKHITRTKNRFNKHIGEDL